MPRPDLERVSSLSLEFTWGRTGPPGVRLVCTTAAGKLATLREWTWTHGSPTHYQLDQIRSTVDDEIQLFIVGTYGVQGLLSETPE